MANRIICLARPPIKGDEYMSVPQLRLIDPATSFTNHKFVPTPESDAALLLMWLEENLPTATLKAFKDLVGTPYAESVAMGHHPDY